MKIPLISTLFFLLCSLVNTAQNNTLYSYKGVWECPQNPYYENIVTEITINKPQGVIWKLNYQLPNPETGDMMQQVVICMDDSLVKPQQTVVPLKSIIVVDTILDLTYGDERFINKNLEVHDTYKKRKAKMYKQTIINDSLANNTADVFSFSTKCIYQEDKKVTAEIVFYSTHQALLFLYYSNRSEVFELKKK